MGREKVEALASLLWTMGSPAVPSVSSRRLGRLPRRPGYHATRFVRLYCNRPPSLAAVHSPLDGQRAGSNWEDLLWLCRVIVPYYHLGQFYVGCWNAPQGKRVAVWLLRLGPHLGTLSQHACEASQPIRTSGLNPLVIKLFRFQMSVARVMSKTPKKYVCYPCDSYTHLANTHPNGNHRRLENAASERDH